MYYILFFLFFIFHQLNCNDENNDMSNKILKKEYKNELFLDDIGYSIEPGVSLYLSLNYFQRTWFFFDLNNDDFIQINLHGINFKFNVDFNGILMRKSNFDTYSIAIDSNNYYIIITPIVDIINGEFKENYSKKSGYLSINSYN